jgi:hypothetical protein
LPTPVPASTTRERSRSSARPTASAISCCSGRYSKSGESASNPDSENASRISAARLSPPAASLGRIIRAGVYLYRRPASSQKLRSDWKAYGLELSIKKQVGTVHGWFNYTYSRSLRKIDGISGNRWYPSNFDKPHDLSLVTNFQINKRNTISVNFVYSTGRAITVPVDRHRLENQFVVLNYSDRNEFRSPDYHRMDVAYTLGQGFRKSRKFKTSWTFSVYNLYARRNAFSIYVVQESFSDPKIKRLSVLGNAFPSLTFNFELL